VPDNNRIWVSIGSTWKFTNKLSADLAYSHVFVKNTSIADVAATGTVYNGTVDSRVDIISASLKYRWDDPVEPVKQRYAK
jgi:long-chain fatty acid transport protein